MYDREEKAEIFIFIFIFVIVYLINEWALRYNKSGLKFRIKNLF